MLQLPTWYTDIPFFWHLPILLALVSLVYSGTRHDDWPSILGEAFRWGSRMAVFMLCVGVAMYALCYLPRWGS
jgi:hypothetical protein